MDMKGTLEYNPPEKGHIRKWNVANDCSPFPDPQPLRLLHSFMFFNQPALTSKTAAPKGLILTGKKPSPSPIINLEELTTFNRSSVRYSPSCIPHPFIISWGILNCSSKVCSALKFTTIINR